MFKIKYGIRLRVTLALAIFSTIIVGTLAISLYFAADDIEEAHIKQIIEAEMDHVIFHFRQLTNFTPQVGSSLNSYVIHNSKEESQLPRHLQDLDRGLHKIFYHDEEMRVFVKYDNGTKFLVAYKIGFHEQRQREFRLLVILSLVGVVVIAFFYRVFACGFACEASDRFGRARKALVTS